MFNSIKIISLVAFAIINTVYSYSQDLEWVRNFGGTINGLDHRVRSAMDKEGNIICSGNYNGYANTYLDFNQTIPVSGVGMAVSKIDSSGNLIWVKTFTGSIKSRDVIILSDSSILISGTISNTINIDSNGVNLAINSLYSSTAFIMKLTSSGQFQWIRQFQQAGLDYFNIATDEQDNIYTGVFFDIDSVDCDPSLLSSYVYAPIGFGAYLSKISNQGELKWVRQFESLTSDGYTKIMDIQVYKDKIHLGGIFNGVVNFEQGTSTHIYEADTSQFNSNALFIMKMDTSGSYDWVKTFSGQESSTNNSGSLNRILDCLVVDTLMNIYAMGNHISPIDFNPDPSATSFYPINGNNTYGYILKLNPVGDLDWVNHAKIGGACIGCGLIISTNQSLAIDKSGFIYWGGFGRAVVDFDPGVGVSNINLSTSGGLFFTKYDTDGNYVSGVGMPNLTTTGSPEESYITSLNILNTGDLFVAGHTRIEIDLDPSANSYILNPPFGTTFIAKYSQDVCSEMFISIDSLELANCAENGYIASTLHHATTPFEFTCNNQNTSGIEFFNVNEYGLKHLYAIDINGCEASKDLLMDGPLYLSSYDLNIDAATSSFRPGFEAFIHLNVINNGCIPQDGEIRLVLDQGLMFNYATVPPSSIVGDTLIWQFYGLNYDSSAFYNHINVTVSNSLQIGDSICIEASVSPEIGDINILNNNKTYCAPLINGYDPNDKQVFPKGKCDEKYISSIDPLTYLIRFQNTGNASAINITVKDSILPFLDLNTVHLLGSSHEMHVEVLNSRNILFVFDSINLPDSTSDFSGSQGSVFFTIKPSSNSITGDTIKNSAEIYFDFNPPIITNETFNTVYEGDLSLLICNLGTTEKTNNPIEVFPNPTTGVIYFNGLIDNSIDKIEVWDISGRLISRELIINQNSIKLKESGLFIITFSSKNTIIGVEKVIVE